MQQSTRDEGGWGAVGGSGGTFSGSAGGSSNTCGGVGGTPTFAGAACSSGYSMRVLPVCHYRVFIGDSLSIELPAGKEPNRFHRKMQEWAFGFRWEYIGCDRAPVGWRCSRDARHSGPCAAHPQGWRKLFWLVRLK